MEQAAKIQTFEMDFTKGKSPTLSGKILPISASAATGAKLARSSIYVHEDWRTPLKRAGNAIPVDPRTSEELQHSCKANQCPWKGLEIVNIH